MKYNIIATGSGGNAVTINDIIMIDCGVPYKKISEIAAKLKIVLLTHIHSDHFKKSTIKKLTAERPTLRFACCEWLADDLTDCGINPNNIDIAKVGVKYNYGKFSISPVKLYHNVPNCGWRIYIDDKKVFYATDTNSLEGITAKGYDLYMVECNYEDKEIQRRIEEKRLSGIYAYENEVLHNHLSKAKCDDFIANNATSESMFVYLHQHMERGNQKCVNI